MVMLGDSSERVLVTLRNAGQGPTTSGIREVDHGVSRPTQLSYGQAPNELVLGPSGYVFGHGGDFYAIRVTSDDVGATAYAGILTKDYAELAYANGLVFTSQGEIADVTQPDSPKWLGKLPVKGLVLPLAKRGDALVLTTTGPSGNNALAELAIRRVSVASLSVVGSVKLPVPATLLNSFENKNLVRVGNSLAFIAQIVVDSPTHVFLVNGVSVVE
jgi:hypothetical protein